MKIVGLVGSLNPESRTHLAVQNALEAAKRQGAEVELYSLRERPLPFYDPSDRDRLYQEESVAAFVQLIAEADGYIIGSPEYHNTMTGVLKNALDFVGGRQFGGKPVGLVSASGGAVATNTINHMLTMFRSLHAYVVPQVGSVGGSTLFTEDGRFVDPAMQERFDLIGHEVASLAQALAATRPAGE